MEKLETLLYPAYARVPYRSHFVFRAVVTVAYTLVLTIALMQSSASPVIGPAAPREFNLAWEILLTCAHIIGFGLLVTLCWWALSHSAPFRWSLIASVLFACAAGTVTELLQAFVPDRSASLFDLLVNYTASLLAAFFITRYHARHPR